MPPAGSAAAAREAEAVANEAMGLLAKVDPKEQVAEKLSVAGEAHRRRYQMLMGGSCAAKGDAAAPRQQVPPPEQASHQQSRAVAMRSTHRRDRVAVKDIRVPHHNRIELLIEREEYAAGRHHHRHRHVY